jgi:hypothetical protein
VLPCLQGWYKAKVAKVNPDGTHLIHFDDGDVQDKVPKERVRPMIKRAPDQPVRAQPYSASGTQGGPAPAQQAQMIGWQQVQKEAPATLARLRSIAEATTEQSQEVYAQALEEVTVTSIFYPLYAIDTV